MLIWLSEINENNTVGAVLLDLTKAFDLVSHKILLQKLRSYKFSNLSIDWFNSYLSDRKQVHVFGKLSGEWDINADVPQDSVLGPLLFILFNNDPPLHNEFCELDLYADDAIMSASSSSLSTLLNFMTAYLSNFLYWCFENDMTLNLAKTTATCMFLSSKQNINRIMSNPPNDALTGESIRISEQEKLLGINIDSTLSWHSQVDKT